MRDFHAVTPTFPAQTPRAERRTFPVVFDKADVVQRRVHADRRQRFEIKLLDIRRRRLQDHLELGVMLQPVGIFTIAAVLWSPRRLHIGGVPGFRTKCAKRRGRVKCARAHFHVVGLQENAAVIGPITLQRQDQSLERAFRAHVRR